MKSSDEMIQELLKRRDDYVAAHHRRNRGKIVGSALSVCVMLALGVIIWQMSITRRIADEAENRRTSEGADSTVITTTANNPDAEKTGAPSPNPPDHNNLLQIDGVDYTVTEVSEILPEGFVYHRNITKDEACGTELEGSELFVSSNSATDAALEEFWLYQPSSKLSAIAYTGIRPSLSGSSEEYPEYIYTHWKIAPPPPEREPMPDSDAR